jgi:hypothetical protein
MAVNVNTAFCYVDGFNLYHSIEALHEPPLKWSDLRALAQSFLSTDDELRGVVYFTAIADWSRLPQHVSNPHGLRVASCPAEYMLQASSTREMDTEVVESA